MFKFKMNDNNWTIEEKMQSEIQETMKQRGNEIEKGSKWFGITMTDTHQIFLDQDLHEDRKRNTLKHELTHCYIVNFMSHIDRNFCEEEVADIVANSIDIINKIVTDYFSKGGKNKVSL